jgi:hypothetical protein
VKFEFPGSEDFKKQLEIDLEVEILKKKIDQITTKLPKNHIICKNVFGYLKINSS